MKVGLGELYHGDCLIEMKKLPSESVDAVITDPPYFLASGRTAYSTKKQLEDIKGNGVMRKNIESNSGYGAITLGFMGQKWDGFIDIYDYQNFSKKWAIEALRVLKPGGFIFAFGGTRTYHRMVCGIEDAGFNVKDSIMWCYASGFPKAQDLAMMIEKKLGGEGEITGTRGYTAQDISGGNYGNSHGNERFEVKNKQPLFPEAKAWTGWKSASLKPAYEPIIVAQKPVEGTIAENVLKNGVGGINVDWCRIPLESNYEYKETEKNGKRGNGDGVFGEGNRGLNNEKCIIASASPEGRFPPNLLSEDNVLDNDEISNSGHWSKTKVTGFGEFGGGTSEYFGVGEKETGGSYNRYFDLDAWFAERIKKLPKEQQKTFPFLFVPKASRGEKDDGLDEFEDVHAPHGTYEGRDLSNPKVHLGGLQGGKAKNFHPTVKPIKIISYLITLSTKENAVILDPFLGSGTTAIACEMLGRKWIGIEKEEEYVKIAHGRLNDFKSQARLGDF